jgi:two-component system sensor histidine kinase UhpB
MIPGGAAAERRCARALRNHLENGDEVSLSQAYEFGRWALARGLGVLDMAMLLSRALVRAGITGQTGAARRVEGFVLECLSPFEMTHRGAREANEALRRLDERREEHVRTIARELHDEAGQLIATLHVALETLRPHLAPGGGGPLDRAFGLLRRVEDEIRRLAHELRPTILDDLGLAPALHFLGEGVARRSGIAVTVEGLTGGRLPPEVETALYRATQEALTNVVRHADATRASVRVDRVNGGIRCRIRDDGRGFDPAGTRARGGRQGIGLEGIRDRVGRLGGTLDIRSGPGGGTELTLRIPLEVRRDGVVDDGEGPPSGWPGAS